MTRAAGSCNSELQLAVGRRNRKQRSGWTEEWPTHSERKVRVRVEQWRKSSQIHSHYERTIADLPWATRPVRLRLHARRFRCANPRWLRRIFTERFPDLVPVRARRTEVQRGTLEDFGFAAGGSESARLALRRGFVGSESTILRLVRARPESNRPAPACWASTIGPASGAKPTAPSR